MGHIKRLWSDEELTGMAETLLRLRRMRTAAAPGSQKAVPWRLRLNHLLGGNEPIYAPQQALAYAEELASAAGEFFAVKISKTGHRRTELKRWNDVLHDGERQFRFYGTTTYARSTLRDAVGNSLLGRLRNLSIDPEYMLEWDLVKNNNLGADSVDDVMNLDMGVFAPLSGDYLLARTYSSYLKRTRGGSFPVRAVALDRDLSEVVLPLDGGAVPFVDKQIVGVYIDTTETGNTGRAVFDALKRTYPERSVLRPRPEGVEFSRSRKIERYFGSD